jgi:hypothetical protein
MPNNPSIALRMKTDDMTKGDPTKPWRAIHFKRPSTLHLKDHEL